MSPTGTIVFDSLCVRNIVLLLQVVMNDGNSNEYKTQVA